MKTAHTDSNQQTKHTPGPWAAKHAEYADADAFEIRANDGARIAEVSISQVLFRQKAAANARLIASAPELLAALEWAHAIMHGYVYSETTEERNHYMADLIHATENTAKAIAHAKGQA